jgi:hypothetical protein
VNSTRDDKNPFSVILKVTNEEEAAACFMKKVKESHFIVSDKVPLSIHSFVIYIKMCYELSTTKSSTVKCKLQYNKQVRGSPHKC